MKLIVGITQLLPEWEILISQIGVSNENISQNDSIKPDQYSVIIVTKHGLQTEKNILLQYLNSGGSILVEANTAEWLFEIKTFQVFVNILEPIKDTIFNSILPGFIQTKLYLPRNGNMLETKSGEKLVQIYTFGKGMALILPGGFSNMILDNKVRRRNFPTRALHLPSERVSRRSKHTIREVIQKSLEHLHFVRQLPFLSLSPFPEGKQSIFNLRIDTDFASEEEIDSFYQLCLKHNISATWFVETKSARNRMKQFTRMENQEIGLHCYQHKVSNKYFFNKSDIQKGTNILNKANITYCGYAAPYGEWNFNIAKAIEQANFIYSSEFTLDYDNLPFYPYLIDHFSSVLQIPVHPICLGRLRNARHSDYRIRCYYKDVINERINHNLPVFIYDHPSIRNVYNIDWLFQYIKQKNLKNFSLKDYAAWWKKRLDMKWVPSINKQNINIEWKRCDSSMYLKIKKSPQHSSIIKVKKGINISEIRWEKKKLSTKPVTNINLRIKNNRKMILNDILYLIRKFK